MSDSLPYGRQWVDEDDIAAVVAALRSDFLTQGPEVPHFESELAAAMGAGHAVAVNSGTAAIHAMYFAAGIGPGDEVITSPLTFAATANAALYLGAKVRFVDVDPESGLIDPSLIEVGHAKAIAPVDFAGMPCDYEALRRLGLPILADSAHSLGARYKDWPMGKWADACATSLHPVKPITTGEGGAVLTDSAELASRAALFRTHGIQRPETDEPWFYEQVELGFNYRMTDLGAALGRSQLKKLAAFVRRRREIAKMYDAGFAELPLGLPKLFEDRESGWHLYQVRVPEPRYRAPLFNALRERGVGAQVHYIPVYWHPYYQGHGFKKGLCPNAERFYETAISLPIYPRLTNEEVASVIDTVSACVAEIVG